jgi:threonine synthase
MSYLSELKCTGCAETYDPNVVQTFCGACQSPLLAYYDLESAREILDRDEISERDAGMWRWREILPIQDPDNVLTLGEGDTPLLHARNLGHVLGHGQLYVKDESLNPTGSFKARGLAAAVSKAKEMGIRKVIIPTAGNAGGAMAAYAARGGLKACIFMPADTPIANIEESRITGAEVIMVDGLISDAAAKAEERAQSGGWFSVSTFKEPYRTEGKKVMGYELAEQFSWTLPDVIIYPTGGGTGLVGMWKAFAEMEALGWLEDSNRPRLVAVQAAGCAPVVDAIESGATSCDFWHGAQTIASGLRVPKSFADTRMLQDIRDSEGTAVAVSDEEIMAAQSQLGRAEGIFAAPEGAATLAGLKKLIVLGWVNQEERIVLFNTGSGLKYVH